MSGQELSGSNPILRALTLLFLSSFVAATAGCGLSSSSTDSTSGTLTSPSTQAISISQFADQSQVDAAVQSALTLTSLPSNVQPPLQSFASNSGPAGIGMNYLPSCNLPETFQSSEYIPSCTFGDIYSNKTIVLLGDSRAEMWFDPLETIASATDTKLVLLSKSGCPSAIGPFEINNNGTLTNSSWPACTDWHNYTIATIKSLAPEIVVVATSPDLLLTSGLASSSSVEADFNKYFDALPSSARIVLLWGFPSPGATANPTLCLAKSPSSIQRCSFRASPNEIQNNLAVERAAQLHGALTINQSEWFCAGECPPVIAGIIPYTTDGYHFDAAYAHYLTGVLWTALKPALG